MRDGAPAPSASDGVCRVTTSATSDGSATDPVTTERDTSSSRTNGTISNHNGDDRVRGAAGQGGST